MPMCRLHCACLLLACHLSLPACGSEPAEVLPCSAAQLRIAEIMADPVGPDVEHEWLEVHNPSAAEAVLDGVTLAVLSGSRRRAVTLKTPHVLAPGGRWVLGNRDGAAPPVDYGYGTKLALPNKRATVRLECGPRLLDEVAYGVDGVPAPVCGVSLKFAGGCWCVSDGRRYDGVNVGAPGKRKTPCPEQVCGGRGSAGPSALVAPHVPG